MYCAFVKMYFILLGSGRYVGKKSLELGKIYYIHTSIHSYVCLYIPSLRTLWLSLRPFWEALRFLWLVP